MYSVKTLNKISPVGLTQLDPKKYTVSDGEEYPNAVLVRSADMHEYPFNQELVCIARAGAGTNNIPVDRCAQAGVVVFNTPGANAESVKELVLCGMLMSSRDVVGGIEWVKETAGQGGDIAKLVEKGKNQFVGPELMGKTLGVIGLGAIGAKLARAALSLGMQVYGYDPYLSVNAAWGLSSGIRHAEDLETIYKNCDYISLHLPYLDSTHEMINRDAIAMMKDGVRVINMARAKLVKDDDIIAALEAGKVAKYVTDFPTDKTAGAKNVIAIPHLGASTPESEDNCAVMAAQEITEFLERGNIRNSVNLPDAFMEPGAMSRLCVIHRNIPAVISGVLKVVSDNGINVENMVNKSKEQYAYSMVDANSPIGEDLLEKMYQIKGVIRLRVINLGK